MPISRSVSPKCLAAPFMIAVGALMLPASSIGQDDTAPTENAANATQETNAEDDMVFLAGEKVTASQSTSDDLFAAGSAVEAKGANADHLFLAGWDVTVSEATVQDVIAAGGNIQLNAATVADDVIVAGGEIVAGENFNIAGTAVIAGGEVRFDAPVGQDLRIGANEIFVNSTVGGNARLTGSSIVLGPKARIAGDLLYRGEALTIDPAAVIEGEQTKLTSTDSYNAEEFGAGFSSFFVYFGLSILISYFVIAALLVIALPGLMQRTSHMLQTTPLKALGIGVLFAVIVPVLGFFLFWTALGIPLAAFLFFASLVLTPVAVAVTAHFVGMAGRTALTKKTGPAQSLVERIGWPLGGVVVLFALAMIPFLGLLVMLFTMLFGLGALLRQAAGTLSAAKPDSPTAGPSLATA